jgi:hypothetical protein
MRVILYVALPNNMVAVDEQPAGFNPEVVYIPASVMSTTKSVVNH